MKPGTLFSPELVASLLEAADAPGDPSALARTSVRRTRRGEVARMPLKDGRLLIVKRGRGERASERFTAERSAAALIRRRTSLVAPVHLDIEIPPDEPPVSAYVRPDLPTLERQLSRTHGPDRGRVLRSWGAVMRELHGVDLPGYGRLPAAASEATPLQWFLARELGVRLFPLVANIWPEALGIVEGLLETIPEIVARIDERPASLVHSRFRPTAVLCTTDGAGPRCAGLVELEDSLAGPVEADLARLRVRGTGADESDMQHVLDGYDGRPDGTIVAFFRCFDLVQAGVRAAQRGHARATERIGLLAVVEMEHVHTVHRDRLRRTLSAEWQGHPTSA